ncbi:MAG: TetR/AcrR family transcriptional regulator [Burkholderiaceae bacterium]
MKEDKQAARREAIIAATYELLAESGYRATSMLAIARRAAASNETLYRWYGNKQGLISEMVAQNALDVRTVLNLAIQKGANPLDTLDKVGPLLLSLVTSEKAVLLNRAAAAEAAQDSSLGEAIASHGRNAVVPLLVQLFESAKQQGQLHFEQSRDIAEDYVTLLIGDWQIRRAIGSMPPLKPSQIKTRAKRAREKLVQLYGKL